MLNKKSNSTTGLELLYIGSVLPDKPEFQSIAFSRAGTMFQENLLDGMKNAGMTPSLILSIRHVQSFPRSPRLLVKREFTELRNGMRVLLLPFLNITPLKQIIIGLFSLFYILMWGWRTRYVRKRVVYTFNLTVPPGIFTLLAARMVGAKAVVSLNDINIPGQTVPYSIINRIDYYMHKKLIPLFDGHVPVSDRIMEDFAVGRPYVRLEGGVTDEMLRAVTDEKNKTTDSTFIIVSAGSLDEANGFRVLLEAFSLLKGDEYRLCIAGGGPLANEIQDAAEKDPRIKFCGFISFAEVLALYRSANVLVNLRLTRALNTHYFFPSKMMEYMASGTPVISTCTGHVEGELGDILFLLKDETPAGLATLIGQLKTLGPEMLAERGLKARSFMAQHKTWNVQGQKVVNYINSLFHQNL